MWRNTREFVEIYRNYSKMHSSLTRQRMTLASGTSRAPCTYVISQFVFAGSPCVSARLPVKSDTSSANYPLLTLFRRGFRYVRYKKDAFASVSCIFFRQTKTTAQFTTRLTFAIFFLKLYFYPKR